MPKPRTFAVVFLTLAAAALVAAPAAKDQPPRVAPGDPNTRSAPADAIVLFDGKDLSAWRQEDGSPAKWTVRDGYFEVKGGAGSLVTKAEFGDVQLHVEWLVPQAEAGDSGQGRGNSGVYLMRRYELQVLESAENKTYPGGMAAAIYKQSPPLVNAGRGLNKWQSYDIIFHRPRFDEDGKCTQPATMTVLHNGVLVQDHFALTGPTTHADPLPYREHPDALPLLLQDHGDPVRYRNIWARPLESTQ